MDLLGKKIDERTLMKAVEKVKTTGNALGRDLPLSKFGDQISVLASRGIQTAVITS